MGLAYGIGGLISVPQGALTGNGPPPASFFAGLGQQFFDVSTTPPTEYVFNGQTWTTAGANPATTTTYGTVLLTDNSQPVATKVYADALSLAGTPIAQTTNTGQGSIATDLEAVAGTANNPGVTALFLTPSNMAAVFAAPPAGGFGSTTPRSVAATTIAASGAVTLSSTLAAGNTTITGTAAISSNATVGGTFGVVGASTIAALSATTGSFSSTLAVTGATTLSSTLAAGNTTITGTLGVSGTVTIAAIAATNGTFSGTLGVTGLSTLGAVTQAGNASFNATGAGTTTIGGASAGAIGIVVGSGGNFSVTTATAGATMAIGSAAQTGIITLGASTAGQTVNISSASTIAGANVVNLISGATPAASQTLNIMTGVGTAGTYAVNILTGNSTGTTQSVSVGTGSARTDVTIGGTGANVMAIANTQTAGSLAIGNAMTTGTVTIGGTAGTGLITIGQATNATGQTVTINSGTSHAGTNVVNVLAGATPAASQTFNLMTGVGSAGTYAVNVLTGASTGTTQTVSVGTGSARTDITLGGTGANVIAINNTTTTGTFSVGDAMTTGTITLGGATGTGIITLGKSTAAGGQTINISSATSAAGAQIVNILSGTTPAASTTLNVMCGAASAGTQTFNVLATGATRAGAVNIANGAAAHVVVLGSTSGAAQTTINSGTLGITMVGNVLKTTNPCFLAYLGATVNNKTGAGTAYTLGTDALTEVFDKGTNFNTNGTFTAPATGIYDLRAQVTLTGCTIATTFVISIVATSRSIIKTFIKAAGSQDESVDVSALVDMTATDTAHVTIAVSGEAGDTVDILGAASAQSFFCGRLVA